MSLQHDIELAMRTGGLFLNGKRITSIKRVAWAEPSEHASDPTRDGATYTFDPITVPAEDKTLCRRTFALGARAYWGAWLDDPRCDVGDIAMFASARPRRCARLFDDAMCGVAS